MIVPIIVDVDGKPLRTVDQIIEEERLSKVFLIAADPAWEHFHPERFPVPLQEWLSNRLPWVRVEQVAGFDRLAVVCDDADNPKLMGEIPHPMFWLNMKEDEASFLANGWPLTVPPPKNGADDFTLYVLSCQPIEAANLSA